MASNPYVPPASIGPPRVRKRRNPFKQLVIGLFAFFMAFWAGAIVLFLCVILHEKGFL